MILSRVLPKPKNSEVAKNWAVFTALFLVFLAFAIALLIAFALPPLLSLMLPDKTSEGTKTVVSLIIQFATTGLFLAISWDMVNAMVGSAIEAAVDEKVRKAAETYERDLSEYKRVNSLETVLSRQNQEFYSTICSITPEALRDGSESPVALYTDESLQKALRRRVARDAITKGFAYNDDLLIDIALSASKHALNKVNISEAEGCRDVDLNIFRQDIYVYLKAWLMFSTAHEREMPVEDIKQRYINKQSPEESWRYYIAALTDIRNRLVRHPAVSRCLDASYREGTIQLADYKEDAILLIEEYLGKLISTLEKRHSTKNYRRN